MGLISMNMEEKIFQIPVEDIIPNRFQPRLTFDEQALQELATSIKQHGIIQPLVLRKLGDKYEIIAGERRYKASQLAGLTTVPAVISNIDDDKSAEVALIENIQRKNLTAIEEAKSYKNLLDRGYLTQEQLADKMGVSQSTIANKLRLLNLADEVQDALLNERISERHARALLAIKDKNEQVKWLNKILNDRLTVRQLDIELKKIQKNDDEDDSTIPIVELTPNINEIKENALDINPTQGLHDIESMLKPSMPGEKVFDLNQSNENVETLDLEEKVEKKEEVKPQNKFFNFLEDEVANMNEETSIDEIFNNTTTMMNKEEKGEKLPIEEIKELNEKIEKLEDIAPINSIIEDNYLNNSSIDNSIQNENKETNDITSQISVPEIEDNNLNTIENSPNNSFFTFNSIENSASTNNDNIIVENNEKPIENNNIIEKIEEPKIDNIFDPMSIVNTLEPDYQEKLEEAQGTDLKTAINTIRETKEELENKGFNISMEEADLGSSYTINISIIK